MLSLIRKQISISPIEFNVDSDLTAGAIAGHQKCFLVPPLGIWDGDAWKNVKHNIGKYMYE